MNNLDKNTAAIIDAVALVLRGEIATLNARIDAGMSAANAASKMASEDVARSIVDLEKAVLALKSGGHLILPSDHVLSFADTAGKGR